MKDNKYLLEATKLLDTYCQGCFLKKHFRKQFSKAVAHQFCMKRCTVGEKLQEYGQKLS